VRQLSRKPPAPGQDAIEHYRMLLENVGITYYTKEIARLHRDGKVPDEAMLLALNIALEAEQKLMTIYRDYDDDPTMENLKELID